MLVKFKTVVYELPISQSNIDKVTSCKKQQKITKGHVAEGQYGFCQRNIFML